MSTIKSAIMLIVPPIIHNNVAGRHVPVVFVLSQLYSIGVHTFKTTEMVPIALVHRFSKSDLPKRSR